MYLAPRIVPCAQWMLLFIEQMSEGMNDWVGGWTNRALLELQGEVFPREVRKGMLRIYQAENLLMKKSVEVFKHWWEVQMHFI